MVTPIMNLNSPSIISEVIIYVHIPEDYLLLNYGLTKESPYDNAVMESFYKTIKRELI